MNLIEKAEELVSIVEDYQNDDGVQLNVKDILDWANQFGENGQFVLSEVTQILRKTYLSKEQCRGMLKLRLEFLQKELRYLTMHEFIKDSHFFDVQNEGKSQKAVLNLIFDILKVDYSISYLDLQLFKKKNFIYFDDLLASGGTIRTDLLVWLLETEGEKQNYSRLIVGEYKLIVSTFGKHVFGAGLCKWQIMMNTDKKVGNHIKFYADIEIEDHPQFLNQSYNCMMPFESEISDLARNYWENIPAQGQPARAFRPENTPIVETLFSSREARGRLEQLFIDKGITILDSVVSLGSNQRPLGMTPPSHRTFGMGTLFFTWRNIPNNAPIVFWWNNNGWLPLFPLKNRG